MRLNVLRPWTQPAEADKRMLVEVNIGCFEVWRMDSMPSPGGSTSLGHRPTFTPTDSPRDTDPSLSVLFYSMTPSRTGVP